MSQPFPQPVSVASPARRRSGPRLLLLTLLLALATPGGAAVRRLTHDQIGQDQPRVNGAGQVIWVTTFPAPVGLYLWDGAAVQPLSTNVDTRYDHQITDSGQVVWQGYTRNTSQLLLWDGHMVRQLYSGPSGDLHWQVNAAGQVVWQASDRSAVQIFLWDGQTTRQLTHGATPSANPQINRLGQVVWESNKQVYLWDGQTVRQLSRSVWHQGSASQPQINNRGQVVWVGSDDGSGDFTLWDGQTARPVQTGAVVVEQLHLSDTGAVAFAGPANGSESLYLWDGAAVHHLSTQVSRFTANASGEVLWSEYGAVFLWDGSRVRQLAPHANFYPEIGLNDAGQAIWQVPAPGNYSAEIDRWDGTHTEAISDTPEGHDPGVAVRHIQIGPTGDVVWVGNVVGTGDEIFLYTPPAPGSLELALPVLPGGGATTGRVTLPEPAPPGGAVVQLASTDPAVAVAPPTVTVPAGMTMATFPVTTSPVRLSTSVTLSAAYGGQTWTATLEVDRVGTDLAGGITQLTNGYDNNASPRLNDAGQVAWLNTPAGSASRDLLWTGGPAPAIVPIATDHTGPPTRINGQGEVLWESSLDPMTGRGLFLWDGRAARQFALVGPNLLAGSSRAQINDQGQILWQSWDLDAPFMQPEGTLWFWDGETRRELAGLDNTISGASLNNRGHVAWTDGGGPTAQILMWDGLTIHPLIDDPGTRLLIQLNDQDQALWWETPNGNDATLVFWDGRAEHRIAPVPGGSYGPPILNNQGWVLWNDNGTLNLWDGSTVRQINGAAGARAFDAGLNDAGEVTWWSYAGGVDQIFLWHDGMARMLLQEPPEDADLQLNNAGQVVWTHRAVGGTAQILLYTPPLALTVSPTPLVGGQPATGTVTLAAPAPAGGTVVQLASQSPAVSVPPAVTIPAGQVSASFPIATTPAPAGARVILTAATADAYRPAVVPILPEGLSLQPDRVLGGQPATGTIVLPRPAPAGGAVVPLASDGPAAQVPPTVTVPAGESVAAFSIVTTAVSAAATVHLTAAYGGARWTATLTVLPPPVLAITVAPNPVSGGEAATGTVTLTGPATAGGTIVQIESDDPAVAAVPATVTVPADAAQATFPIQTRTVAQATAVTISATAGTGMESAILQVVPVRLVSVQVNPNPVAGPGFPPPQVTITLSGPAPPGGAAVQLSSDHPELVSFLASDVPPGLASVSTPLTVGGAGAATNVVITARYAGETVSTTLRLLPPGVASLELLPDHVAGGAAVQGQVTLNGFAPLGGVRVQLSSDHPEIVAVPAQVTVPDTAPPLASFPVTTRRPAQDTVVQITATAGGQSRSAALTVYAVSVAGLTLSPPVLRGGMPALGRVTLNGPAPAGGVAVPLFGMGSGATAPDQVTVPAGASEATFPIATQEVSIPTSFSMEAVYGGMDRGASLQIVPLAVASLTLQPADVTGGASGTGTVILNFPAGPGGATVTLDSSAPSVAGVPASVVVPAGETSARFPVATQPVAADTTLVIRATLGRSTQPANLRVRAPLLNRVTLEPAMIPGGGTVVGRIDLTGPAPAGGVQVALASGDPDVAGVPAFITVPPGASEAEFTITTHPVAAPAQIPIGAAVDGVSRSAVLTVLPPPPGAG